MSQSAATVASLGSVNADFQLRVIRRPRAVTGYSSPTDYPMRRALGPLHRLKCDATDTGAILLADLPGMHGLQTNRTDRNFMKRAIAIVAAVVVATAAAVVALPWLLTPQLFGSQIQDSVEGATGHSLSFTGGPRLTLWPEVTVALRQVELSNPPATFEGRSVIAESVRFKVSLGSLLRRAPEVEEIIVVRPRINLVIDESGRSNFAPRPTDGAAQRPREPQVPEAGNDDAALPPISIVDGELKYLNERSGAALALSNVDLTLSGSGLDDPLGMRGGFDWGQQRIAVAAYIKSPARLTEDGSPSDVTITSPLFNAAFNGRTILKDGIELAGRLDFRTDSLSDLAGSGGLAASAPQLTSVSAAGAVDLSRNAVRFTDAELTLGSNTAKGDLAVSFKGERPRITAKLSVDRLDLSAARAADKPQDAEPMTGWSAAPIDLSGLKTLDADITLTVAEIAYRDARAGSSRLDLKLDNGRLDAILAEMALYGGSASGRITADGSRPVPRFSATVTGRNIDGGRLIADLTGLDRIDGKADLELELAAAGTSQRELIGMLRGDGRLSVTDGAVAGLDVAALLDDLEAGVLEDWTAADRRTHFASLAASFAVRDGIAETDDLAFVGPAARVSGTGSIDILSQRLNLELLPQVRDETEAAGEEGFRAFPVPVVIDGLWSAPRIYPGIEGILDDPEKALKVLRQRLERQGSELDLGVDKIEKALKKASSLLGKARLDAAEDPEAQPESPETTP